MTISISWRTGKEGGSGRSDLKQIEDMFMSLAKGLSPEELSAAVEPAAQLVLETAQRLAPVRGPEQRSRYVKGFTKPRGYGGGLLLSLFAAEEYADASGASWEIGCKKFPHGWYAAMVEFGTQPHEQGKGKSVHTGARAHPFLRPALDMNQAEIVRLIGEGIAKAIEARETQMAGAAA